MSDITSHDRTATARNSILLDACDRLTPLIDRSIYLRMHQCTDNFIFCVAKKDAVWVRAFKNVNPPIIEEFIIAKLMHTEALEKIARFLKFPKVKMLVEVPKNATKIVLIAYEGCSVYIVRREAAYSFDI